MPLEELINEDVARLVDGLNFAQKVERSLELIRQAYAEHGDGLVVANSLGKDSVAVWHLAKSVSPDIRGFIVTTRYKPRETLEFMHQEVARYPELRVFRNDAEIPADLHQTNPDRCCDILKVEPTRQAIEEMGVTCWVTGLRCTSRRVRISSCTTSGATTSQPSNRASPRYLCPFWAQAVTPCGTSPSAPAATSAPAASTSCRSPDWSINIWNNSR